MNVTCIDYNRVGNVAQISSYIVNDNKKDNQGAQKQRQTLFGFESHF